MVNILTKRDFEGQKEYSPVYKYSYLGREYTVHENTYRSSISLKIGDNIDIFINENKPDEFYIKHISNTISLIIIGVILISISIRMFFSIIQSV